MIREGVGGWGGVGGKRAREREEKKKRFGDEEKTHPKK